MPNRPSGRRRGALRDVASDVMKTRYKLYFGIVFVALVFLAIGGWVVSGTRKVLSPPRLRPA
jgi:hypothetical protein